MVGHIYPCLNKEGSDEEKGLFRAWPSWGAAMLMTVARATGWPEGEILWEIPLARLEQAWETWRKQVEGVE